MILKKLTRKTRIHFCESFGRPLVNVKNQEVNQQIPYLRDYNKKRKRDFRI